MNAMQAITTLGAEYDLAVDVWARGLDYDHYVEFSTTLIMPVLNKATFDAIWGVCQAQYNEDMT